MPYMDGMGWSKTPTRLTCLIQGRQLVGHGLSTVDAVGAVVQQPNMCLPFFLKQNWGCSNPNLLIMSQIPSKLSYVKFEKETKASKHHPHRIQTDTVSSYHSKHSKWPVLWTSPAAWSVRSCICAEPSSCLSNWLGNKKVRFKSMSFKKPKKKAGFLCPPKKWIWFQKDKVTALCFVSFFVSEWWADKGWI